MAFSHVFSRAVLVFAFFGAAEMPAQSASGSLDSDALVVVGAGAAGSWVTEYELANGDPASIQALVGPAPFGVPCPPLQACEQAGVGIPGRGTAKISNVLYSRTFVGSTFVTAAGATLPTVRARIINSNRPSQAIELPVTRLSTISALNPSELVFPTAARTSTAHSNLVLSELSLTAPVSLRVEAYSADGTLVGTRVFDVDRGNSIFLVDVLSQLGVLDFANGQVRVVKIGGGGLLWGLLATVTSDGQVFVSLGRNP